MTDTTDDTTDDPESIAEKRERVETIVERLERGDVSLERAKALRDEGRRLLAELEADLDLGEGTVTEVE